MPISAAPLPPAIVVGFLTLLSTLIASVTKVRALRAKPTDANQPRRFLNYPLLGLISLCSLLIFSGGSILYDLRLLPTDATATTVLAWILLVANVAILACWIYTIARSAQLRRRDWVINMITGIALGSPLFSIWGPTARRGDGS